METVALTDKPARWISVYAGFVLTGMVTTLLGPMLPVIAVSTGRKPTDLGLLFTAQFLSSTAVTLLAGVLSQRFGFRVPLALGYALMGVGVGTLLFSPWPWVLCAVASCGFGIGFVIPASNILIAEASENRGAALSRLNACWAAGAILFPLVVAAGLRNDNLRAVLVGGGVALLAWSAWMGLARWPSPTVAVSVDTGSNRPKLVGLAIFAALFFLYVGSENSVSGWIAAYSRSMGLEHTWILTPSLFWLCLVAGRVIAPRVLRHTSEYAVCLAGLVVSIVGSAVLAEAQSPITAVVGSAVSGFGLSAVYPIFIASLSRVLGEHSRKLAGTAFAISGLGGATLPWFIGALANGTGNMRWALTVPVGGCAAMLAIAAKNKAMFETRRARG